jgi:hypothetical protein
MSEAYKDLQHVVDVVERAGLSRVVARLRLCLLFIASCAGEKSYLAVLPELTPAPPSLIR